MEKFNMSKIIGTPISNLIIVNSSDDTIMGMCSTDTISANARNVNIDEIGNIVGSNIDGGSGYDNLTIHENRAAVTLGTNLKGIKNFNFEQGSSSSQTVKLTNDAFTGLQGSIIKIKTWNDITYIKTSAVTAGNLILNGNSGNDTLLGFSGNDFINGHGGIDSIDGCGGQNTAGFSLGLVLATEVLATELNVVPISAAADNFTQNMVGVLAGDVNGNWAPLGSSYLNATITSNILPKKNPSETIISNINASLNPLITFSNIKLDITNNITADMFVSLISAADSFDIYLSMGNNSTNATFTSALSPLYFNVISSSIYGSELNIAGFGNIIGTSTQLMQSGQTKIGSIKFNIGLMSQYQISILDGTDFNNSTENQQYKVTPNTITLKIDATAPTAATLVQGSGTNSKVLTLTGVETGGTVKILNGTTDVTSKFTVGTNGTYTANVGAFTGAETFSLTAMVTDVAGNTSAASNAVTGKIDTVAPTLAITSTAGSTNTTIQTISGTVGIADAGLTISIYDGTTLIGTTSTDGTGTWSKAVTLPSAQGSQSITAQATDAAGNVGTSNAVVYVLNTLSTNIITGSADNAPITGTAGDDVITANTGTKSIDGGAGTNTVVFAGTKSQFRVGLASDGTIIVKGANVSDTLTNIQQLQFGSGTTITPALVQTDQLLKAGAYNSSNQLVSNWIMPDANPDTNVAVDYRYIADQTTAVTNVINGTNRPAFLKGGPATDAIAGGTGNDVIDGGTGSNFLTGSGGWDTFFIDGRGGQFTWGTITDYTLAAMGTPNESVSIWGWNSGVSRMAWEASNGAAGYQGATLKLDINNDGIFDAYVTFTGLTQSQLPTPVEFTPAQTSGNGLLWFK